MIENDKIDPVAEPVVDEKANKDKLSYSIDTLIQCCLDMIEKSDRQVVHLILAVDLPKNTKKNRIRISAEDRASPFGVIVRNDPIAALKFNSASAKFDCHELLPWLVMKRAQITEIDLG